MRGWSGRATLHWSALFGGWAQAGGNPCLPLAVSALSPASGLAVCEAFAPCLPERGSAPLGGDRARRNFQSGVVIYHSQFGERHAEARGDFAGFADF
jgi:hypothetical protein